MGVPNPFTSLNVTMSLKINIPALVIALHFAYCSPNLIRSTAEYDNFNQNSIRDTVNHHEANQ
jgi:hypothetical protein